MFVCLFDTHASRSRPAATAQSDSQDSLSAWLANVADAQRLLSAPSDLRGVACQATRTCNSEAFALRTSVCLRLSVNSDELASCRWPATLTRGIRHTDEGCTRYQRWLHARDMRRGAQRSTPQAGGQVTSSLFLDCGCAATSICRSTYDVSRLAPYAKA